MVSRFLSFTTPSQPRRTRAFLSSDMRLFLLSPPREQCARSRPYPLQEHNATSRSPVLTSEYTPAKGKRCMLVSAKPQADFSRGQAMQDHGIGPGRYVREVLDPEVGRM